MISGARRVLVGFLRRSERVSRRLRESLDRAGRAKPAEHCAVPALHEPPSEAHWQDYIGSLGPVQAVTEVCGAVSKALLAETVEGETLLEAGCGTAVLSAQMALAGRRILLCDFSKPILERALEVFEASALPTPDTFCCDITQGLPFGEQSIDVVWSSGVLEHWPDEEVQPILKEMARVARRAVISFVPNANCLMYMAGKTVAEQTGAWPFGRERPRTSMRHLFEQAGLCDIREYTVDAAHGLELLLMQNSHPVTQHSNLRNVLDQLHTRPEFADQGYLLMTVGYKEPGGVPLD